MNLLTNICHVHCITLFVWQISQQITIKLTIKSSYTLFHRRICNVYTHCNDKASTNITNTIISKQQRQRKKKKEKRYKSSKQHVTFTADEILLTAASGFNQVMQTLQTPTFLFLLYTYARDSSMCSTFIVYTYTLSRHVI